MKRLVHIDKAKTKWARECLKEHGQVVQVAQIRPGEMRFVSVKEEGVDDIRNLKHWSYWVGTDEIEWTELNPEFQQQEQQMSLI